LASSTDPVVPLRLGLGQEESGAGSATPLVEPASWTRKKPPGAIDPEPMVQVPPVLPVLLE